MGVSCGCFRWDLGDGNGPRSEFEWIEVAYVEPLIVGLETSQPPPWSPRFRLRELAGGAPSVPKLAVRSSIHRNLKLTELGLLSLKVIFSRIWSLPPSEVPDSDCVSWPAARPRAPGRQAILPCIIAAPRTPIVTTVIIIAINLIGTSIIVTKLVLVLLLLLLLILLSLLLLLLLSLLLLERPSGRRSASCCASRRRGERGADWPSLLTQ